LERQQRIVRNVTTKTYIFSPRRKVCVAEMQHPVGNGATVVDLKGTVSTCKAILGQKSEPAERLEGRLER
jgi:hypothetical protein